MPMPRWFRRAVQLGGAAACLLATTQKAFAFPVLIALLAAVGVTGTTATVIANIALIAAGIGLSILLTPKPPKPEQATISVQQDNPPIIYVYGDQVRVAGAIALKDSLAGYLCIVQALAGHEVEFSGTFYLNDDRVTLLGGLSGYITPLPSAGKYELINIDTRAGLAVETNYSAITALDPLLWPSTARGDATASMVTKCKPGKVSKFAVHYPVGQPDPSAVISGTRVFNPADVDQDPDDPSTFKFAGRDNVALALMHWICFSPYGATRSYDKAILPIVDLWNEEVALCDEFVAKKVGTERRYKVGGSSTTDQDNRSTMKVLRESAAGKLIERGDGSIRFWCGVYRAPEFVITDADIIDFTLTVGREQPSGGNSWTVKYTSPDNDWTTVPTDPTEWLDDQLAWGQRHQVTLERPWVQNVGQASRIKKRAYLYAKQATRGTLRLRWSGLAAAYEYIVGISSNSLPPRLRSCSIEVTKAVISVMTGIITIDFIRTDASIDDYDPAVDESAPAPVITKPADQALYVPSNVDAFAYQQGGSSFLSMVVDFDTPEISPGVYRDDLDYRVHWRIKDIGGGVPGAWSDQFFDNVAATTARSEVIVSVVPRDVILEVEIRSETQAKGTPSDWSDRVDVDTSSVPAVIPGPPILSVTGTTSAILTTANTSSSNLAAVKFYRSVGGDPFSMATLIYTDSAPIIGGTSTYTDTPATGHWSYWATSSNSAGGTSAPDGPRNFAIADILGAGSGDMLGAGGGDILGAGGN